MRPASGPASGTDVQILHAVALLPTPRETAHVAASCRKRPIYTHPTAGSGHRAGPPKTPHAAINQCFIFWHYGCKPASTAPRAPRATANGTGSQLVPTAAKKWNKTDCRSARNSKNLQSRSTRGKTRFDMLGSKGHGKRDLIPVRSRQTSDRSGPAPFQAVCFRVCSSVGLQSRTLS